MNEKSRDDEINPYESPRHINRFYTVEELIRLAWIKDRMALGGCGLLISFTLWGMIIVGTFIAWLLGYLGPIPLVAP